MTKKSNIEIFISKYMERYPESKLSFDKSVYIDSHTKMIVTCPVHGDFDIRPYDLLKGTSCPKCSRTYHYSTEEFIKRANFVHNGYFSYERCVYNGSNKTVVVTCPIHGDFEVKANNHLNGSNCSRCSSERIIHKITKIPNKGSSTKGLSNDDFIKKIISKYGNKYILDKVRYKNNRTKIIVTCKEHGDFTITPNHLLNGNGCPICSKNKRKTKDDIISEIKKVHGNKYNVDDIVYNGIHRSITLLCNHCGNTFTNTPTNIIRYNEGCPYCCPKSKMENEIETLLIDNNIRFIREKKFDWLKNKRSLSLDFYLPEYNMAIECQGIQHFDNKSFFSKNSNLIENDIIKNRVCKEHGIQIIYYANYKCNFNYNVITNADIIIDMLNKQNNVTQ
jgi:hypothetical protein